jgi:16S rRNA processing protein RimM
VPGHSSSPSASRGQGGEGVTGAGIHVAAPEPKICVGVVVGAQGIKGAVRIKPFTDRPEAVAAYGPVTDEAGARRFEVKIVGQARGVVTAQLSGVTDRNAAEALKGLRLYVPRAALPEPEQEEFYHADLIGLAAERADGSPLGRVKAVLDHGAGTYLEIVAEGGRPLIVPFTRAAVPVVDLAAGRLVIEPPAEIGARPGEEEEG